MKFLAKAIVTGFGLSIGAALFKKVSSYVGLDEAKKKKEEDEADKVTTRDGATDPALQH
jgi:hypothetical protein